MIYQISGNHIVLHDSQNPLRSPSFSKTKRRRREESVVSPLFAYSALKPNIILFADEFHKAGIWNALGLLKFYALIL